MDNDVPLDKSAMDNDVPLDKSVVGNAIPLTGCSHQVKLGRSSIEAVTP